MESFATPYPVIFFDGEQEQDVGYIGIHSMLTYKRFQSLLSQKTRVPANQLSAVFVCRRAQKGTERRQRLPINGNTNFSILLNQHNPSKEKDCYFSVSVKRSKKDRRGSRKRSAEIENSDDWESVSSLGDSSPFEERVQVSSLVDEMLLPEEVLLSFIQGNTSSPGKTAMSGIHEQRSMDSRSTQHGGFDFGAAADRNIGKFLLRRQVTQSNVSPAPRRGRTSTVHGLEEASTHIGKGDAGISHREQQKSMNFWTQESSNGQESNHLKLHAPVFLPSHHAYHTYEAFYPERFSNTFPDAPFLKSSSSTLQRSGILPQGNMYQTLSPAPRIPSVSPVGTTRDTDLRATYNHLFQLQQSQTFTGEVFPNFFTSSGTFAGFQDTETGGQNVCCEVCFDCKKRNIVPIPFHWCVQDEVISGFRGPSPAGPICRPPQAHHVKAAA